MKTRSPAHAACARVAAKIAWALLDKHHPVLVHLIPMRRCNLACRYCNEYDARLRSRFRWT